MVHTSQVAEAGAEEKLPAAQGEHAQLLAFDENPDEHATHDVLRTVEDEMKPAKHPEQVAEPATDEEPQGQSLHELCPEKPFVLVPAGH